jgi:hypothetical protein
MPEVQALSLFVLEAELAELLELREEMVAAGELPESIAATDKQIEAYCSAEVAKVDRIAGAIRACERNYATIQHEMVRLEERARAWVARRDRIKDAALRAMQARGIKSLETPENKLTVCGNGGVEPLEFTGEPVPQEYCYVTVKMPASSVRELMNLSKADIFKGTWNCRTDDPGEPRTDAIRAALQRGESVPGARLKERGSHLKLS